MNRENCEKIILEKIEEIVKIYHEYNPGGRYLTFNYMKDDDAETLFFFNRHYGEDAELPIDRFKYLGGCNG